MITKIKKKVYTDENKRDKVYTDENRTRQDRYWWK